MKQLFLLLLSVSFAYSQTPKALQRLAIEADHLMIEWGGDSRELAYTNKEAGVWYTETGAEHRNAWQGWRIMSQEVMEGYQLTLGGIALAPRAITSTTILPNTYAKSYGEWGREHVTLLDSINALVVEITKDSSSTIVVHPLFQHSKNHDDYIVRMVDSMLLIARKAHLQRTPKEDYPVWIGVKVVGTYSTSELKESVVRGFGFGPVGIRCEMEPGKQRAAIFVAGNTEEETVSLGKKVARDYPALIKAREERIMRMVNDSYIRTDNPRFDKALQWAKISMDALIMNQVKKGIFAGLPWFDNYWGRDSFIALPGATLVTGNFTEAKDILRSFAEWQEKDEKNQNFGRIPNLVTTTSIAYNTADGTPRFINALWEYVKYSNDTAFARELYPVVQRAMEGTIRYHIDGGFLAHGDAETWMDAVGTEGAWSPRGNRANDLQALWYGQLLASAEMARIAGDIKSEADWKKRASDLQKKFLSSFLDKKRNLLVDHLNTDGSRDMQLRPNQLFAMPLVTDTAVRANIFRTITSQLVYPHGVASLSQDDPNFHPYHQYAPFYPKDAAYHNGVVWTWLAGAWIDLAAEFGRQDLGYTVTESMIGQMMEEAAIGTIPELVDAAVKPKKGKPEFSGTFSQAWSLAEFIRTAYQTYLGITVDATKGIISINPRFPPLITQADFNLHVGNARHRITLNSYSNKAWITVNPDSNLTSRTNLDIRWIFRNGNGIQTSVMMDGKEQVKIGLRENGVNVSYGTRQQTEAPWKPAALPAISGELASLTLATPVVRPDLKSLKGPDHRLLSNQEIKRVNTIASLLYEASDPEGDDRGTKGSYVYPQTASLQPGSLDLIRAKVSTDGSQVYFTLKFKNLSDPGWHPEYGFQLTYAAIAVDTDGKGNSSNLDVGMNSHYKLPSNLAYERIIYVGGGIRVADRKGKILAEYLPVSGDEKNPLGDARSGEISFALPVELFGAAPIPGWKFSVVVGAQDDHGGAGIGEFRSVGAEAGEWIGGGRTSPTDSNVYDVLLPP